MSGNHTEAALTLQLHAELLGWTEVELGAEVKYPAEQEWQRKERLYHRMLAHFDKGKVIMLHCPTLYNYYFV